MSGVSLAAGALGGSALFGRGRPASWIFAAIVVSVSTLVCGWAASSVFTHLTAGQQGAETAAEAADSSVTAAVPTSRMPTSEVGTQI